MSTWGNGGQDNIGSAVPMFGAGPEEPPWPVIVVRGGWFVVCMTRAGAEWPPPMGRHHESSIPGAAAISLTTPIFFERDDTALRRQDDQSNVEISKAVPACPSSLSPNPNSIPQLHGPGHGHCGLTVSPRLRVSPALSCSAGPFRPT